MPPKRSSKIHVFRFSLCLIVVFALYLTRSQSGSDEIQRFTSGRSLLEEDDSACGDVVNMPKDQQCEYAQKFCADPVAGGLLNYMTFRYCHMEKMPALAFIILALWLGCLFYLLGNTAEDFFCPALERMSDAMKLTPSVAGVTLLALGNGASDIATILVGIFNPSVSAIGLGEPIGAGAFNITIIIGTVAILAPTHLSKGSFLRDVIAFLVAMLAIFVVSLDGKVTLWEGIVFLIIYAIYVAIVAINDHFSRTHPEQDIEGFSVNHHHHQEQESPKIQKNSEFPQANEKTNLLTPSAGNETSTVGHVKEMAHGYTHKHREEFYAGRSFRNMVKDAWIDLTEYWNSKTKLQKIVLLPFEAPLRLIRMVSIPNADESCWMRLVTVLVPIGSLQFILFAFGESGQMLGGVFPLWTLFLIIGSIFSVAIFRTTEDEKPPKYHMVLVCWCFVCSIAWIYVIANELVSVAASVGMMFGMSPSLMGITLLAIGNSVADFVPDIVVARHGYPSMAVAASYGSPVLNILLGLGLSLTTTTAINYPQPYHLEADITTFIAFYSIFAFLALTLIVVPLTKFHVKKWFGGCMIAGYVLFMILEILANQKVIF